MKSKHLFENIQVGVFPLRKMMKSSIKIEYSTIYAKVTKNADTFLHTTGIHQCLFCFSLNYVIIRRQKCYYR